MANPTGIDKRSFKRLTTALDVSVHIESTGRAPSGLPQTMHATCRNLSLRGMCLETSCLANGAVKLLSGRLGERDYKLALEIPLKPDDPPVQARGEVCWYNVDHTATDFTYQVGIEFIEIAPKSRAMLKRFVKNNCCSRSLLRRIKDFLSGI
jgi:hypothetical protein